MNENATLDILKKKINNKRTAFRRELKKVQDYMGTGTGTDDICESSLWYFDLLLFTSQSERGRKGISNVNGSEHNNMEQLQSMWDNAEESQDTSVFLPKTPPSCLEGSSPQEQDLLVIPQTNRSTSQSYTSSSSVSQKPRKSGKSVLEKKKVALMDLAHKTLSGGDDDEFDITWKRIACQLRGMNERQRLIAEKLVSDVMFHGRMGNLPEDASISLPSKRLHYSYDSYNITFRPIHPFSPDHEPTHRNGQQLQNPEIRTDLSPYLQFN
ncbi:unnamed protein product [Psylliodes chrysocephalus]|uniref:MADF domain-containing protein n=1 Tax=Psylliodes chrysocephalus TaxID=3402493 RepID=A0A9P0CRD2_9CUCU|nr:unnamed protein product [Psylliodes chrysocephala]